MTLSTQTVQDGPFTITAVQDTDLQLLFLGAAVCGARDEYDPAIGKAISEGRAMAARAEYYAEQGNPIQETVPVLDPQWWSPSGPPKSVWSPDQRYERMQAVGQRIDALQDALAAAEAEYEEACES